MGNLEVGEEWGHSSLTFRTTEYKGTVYLKKARNM
jgi:hypothetical protein